MDLILVFLKILLMGHNRSISDFSGPNEAEPRLTLLSLSNSVNMTACFGFRCRRMYSLTYGINVIITDKDCEASATMHAGHEWDYAPTLSDRKAYPDVSP